VTTPLFVVFFYYHSNLERRLRSEQVLRRWPLKLWAKKKKMRPFYGGTVEEYPTLKVCWHLISYDR
jgi:hypothetical protein